MAIFNSYVSHYQRVIHLRWRHFPRLLALSFGLSLAAALVYCGQHNGGAEIPKEDADCG
jgi:hypothetical protein